jgi:hypothetical protein
MWPGLYSSAAGRSSQWSTREILMQIGETRTLRSPGHAHFRLADVLANAPLRRALGEGVYAEYSAPPRYPWLSAPPAEWPLVHRSATGIQLRGTAGVRWALLACAIRNGAVTNTFYTRVFVSPDSATRLALPAVGRGQWMIAGIAANGTRTPFRALEGAR